ncbi:MAG: thiamine-phosphate kinase [Candidatus Lightella neohaematopini]|nr:thiamine-phosphate kinase [Candidatus Lightella neohaematopini]MCV2528915.1 thiamine-phosphate kinase [Candidatus Lightella neohaematopini]
MNNIINESYIVNRFFKKKINDNYVKLGIGDDCALLSINSNKYFIAISTNSLVSGVHFLPNINPSNLGYKIVIINVSDIIAMGAKPKWITMSLILPKYDEYWLSLFSNELFKQLDYYNISLIGGNLSSGNLLSITVTIYGIVPIDKQLTKFGMNINDMIYVTGTLGDSAYGLEILKKNIKIFNKKHKLYFIDKHLRPKPPVKFGQKIRMIANSATDISDGILKEIYNMVNTTKYSAKIYLNRLPLSNKLKRYVNYYNALNLVCNSEDYELCFTIKKNNIHLLNKLNTNTKITCIGKIIPYIGRKLLLLNYDKKLLNNPLGYDHFN